MATGMTAGRPRKRGHNARFNSMFDKPEGARTGAVEEGGFT